MRLITLLHSIFIITTTSTAVEFECLFHSEDFPSSGFAYSCVVTNGYINSTSGAEVKSVSGLHRDKHADDVTGISIFFKNFNYFPLKVTKYFKNIEVVSVEFSHLKKINKNDFKQFGNKLIDLDLEGNEIESLEKDLFMYNSNLKYISLISNKIQKISENVFDSLNELYGINLIDNNCINYVYYGREIRDFVRCIKLKCNENFSSKGIRIPTIVSEAEYNTYLVKLYKKKVSDLEKKVKEMERTKCEF